MQASASGALRPACHDVDVKVLDTNEGAGVAKTHEMTLQSTLCHGATLLRNYNMLWKLLKYMILYYNVLWHTIICTMLHLIALPGPGLDSGTEGTVAIAGIDWLLGRRSQSIAA